MKRSLPTTNKTARKITKQLAKAVFLDPA